MPRLVLLAARAYAFAVALLSASPAPAGAPVTAPTPATAMPGDGLAPLTIHLACQRGGRTRACPAFLRGLIDESPLLRFAPRASADVVLYVNATALAGRDRIHLRFVGQVEGAPPAVEAIALLDTRAGIDAQRDALRRAFLRGVALFVAARHPAAVEVTLAAQAPVPAASAAGTTPWGVALNLGGFGSYTESFRSLSGWSGIDVSRVEPTAKLALSVGGRFGIQRQPPLVIDGQEISLDRDEYSVYASGSAARHLSPHWAVGAQVSASHDDPEGQHRLRAGGDVGIEWDRFHADDPRGNKLAVGYQAGYVVERYNTRNVLGERRARYVSHELFASGSVRADRLTYGLYLSAWSELVHPGRRHSLSASPSLTLQLGDHVDLGLSLSVTQRAVPGPAAVDQSDFEEVTRASYAEPFSVGGSMNVSIHWDRSNGARNDRFGSDG